MPVTVRDYKEERPLEKGRAFYITTREMKRMILPVTESYSNSIRILFNTGNVFL